MATLKKFKVRTTEIKDNRDEIVKPGEIAHLDEKTAKHYNSLGFLHVDVGDFDDDASERKTGTGTAVPNPGKTNVVPSDASATAAALKPLEAETVVPVQPEPNLGVGEDDEGEAGDDAENDAGNDPAETASGGASVSRRRRATS